MMMHYNAVFWFICLFVLVLMLEAIYPLGFEFTLAKELGLFALFASLLIALWTKYLYHRHNTSYDPNDRPALLITESIYARSRNPIYLALLFGFFGLCLLLSLSYGLLGTLFLYLILSNHIIPHEEEELRRIFKQTYNDYASSTPKWL